VAAVAATFILALLLTPHGGGQMGPGGRGPGGPGGRPTTVVGVATVVKGDIPIVLEELGAVSPVTTVTVQPRVAGNIVKIDFREGQMVKAGQVIEEIDDRPYVIAVKQAQGQLLKDQAALDDAKLDLKRYQSLTAQDSVAKQTLDTQAALVKQDQGVVVIDQAALDNAKLNVEYCHITAPVDGRIGLRQVDLGNYVSSNSTTTGLVVITAINPIDVVFTLPEDSVPQVQARLASGATLTATALDRSGAQVLAQGTLATLDNEIDSSTGTVKAKAHFDNGSGVLFPQQFVNIRLLVDTMRDAIIVPTQAVRHGSQGDYIYTVDLDQNAKMTPVKVGPADGERTSILSGVQVGDVVVTEGGDRLHDGAPVTLPADAAAIQNAPPPAKKGGLFSWLGGLFGKKAPSGASGAPGPSAQASGGGWGGGQQGGAGGHGGWGGGHGGGAHLQALISSLDLSPDQMTQARAIMADMHTKMAAAGDDPAGRRAAMQADMAQFEAILTPEQKTKFERERAKQRAAGGQGGGAPPPGPEAAGGPPPAAPPAASSAAPPARSGGWNGRPGGGEGGQGGGRLAMLTDALGLDADQQAKAREIFAAARAKAQASGDPDAYRTAMKEANTQLEAILRPEQKAKFVEMRAHMGGPPGGGAQ
jgi:multidrug efflux system membrane fusion protein